jgi:hypothetical protein
MKFDKLQPGMTLYDVHSARMGNTTMKTLGTWAVYVREVDAEKRRALVSWNGNPAEWRGESYFDKLKDKKPYLVKSPMGYYRRPTREELAAHRAEMAQKGKTR